MYDYISGILTTKSPTCAIIETSGIGYQFTVPISTYQCLPDVGRPVKLLAHFVVREDAQILFGFLKEEERDLFRLLISVSSIGPKLAVTILSGIGIAELKQAIVSGAVPALTSVSGIGKKTAERLIVELREKILLDHHQAKTVPATDACTRLTNDSLKALVSLGYGKQNAKAAVQKVLSINSRCEELQVDEVVRQSLRYV